MIGLVANRKGFALAIILGLLPVLLGGFFAASVSIAIIQTDLRFKHICRSDGIRTQEKVSHHLHRLMSLNPRAAQLRLQLQSARLALATAMAAQNPVAAAKILKQIAHLTKKQASLDVRQKQLISESNRELILSYRRVRDRLNANGLQSLKNFPGLSLHFKNRPGHPPRLAVEPDSPDVAPLYRTPDRFEERQALAHRWHFQLSIRPPLSGYIGTQFRFEKSCSVSLSQKGMIWVTKIIKDKSLSKSAW